MQKQSSEPVVEAESCSSCSSCGLQGAVAKDENSLDFDVMIVGAGIAGMEAAASLGDMGYNVALVEKQSSIGG